MNSKLSDIYRNSYCFDVDIIVFTETWLRPSILNTEILCSTFQIFRRDEGGVLIATRSNYITHVIDVPNTQNVEFIAVSVKINNKMFYIISKNIKNQEIHCTIQHTPFPVLNI